MSLSKEAHNAAQFLASAGPLASYTLKNADADELVLEFGGLIFGSGHLYKIVCEQASPGVCRLSLRSATP